MPIEDKPTCAEPCAGAFEPPSTTKKKQRQGRSRVVDTQVVDIDHAVRELAEARREIAAVPVGLNKHERAHAMLEPMSRLSLVVRFCEGVLERNGWEREVVPT